MHLTLALPGESHHRLLVDLRRIATNAHIALESSPAVMAQALGDREGRVGRCELRSSHKHGGSCGCG